MMTCACSPREAGYTRLTSKRGQNDSKEKDLQKSQSLSTQGFVMNGNSEAVPLEGP